MKKKVFIGAMICFLIDIISKILITIFNKDIIIIPNFFNLTFVKNTGAAFSFGTGYVYFFAIMALVALVYIIKYMLSDKMSKIEIVSYALLIGGIFGNLFDRIRYGYVIDFLSFNIFGYNFPIFNFADVFICVGASIMIFNLIKGDINGNNGKH